MNVFSKYLVRSMAEKKGRTFLLLISVAISAALLVASMGAVKALLGTFSTQIKGNFGDFNVQIAASPSAELPLFSADEIKDSHIKKSYKGVSIGGYLSTDVEKQFGLTGTTLEDFKNFDSIKFIEQDNLEPFTGKKLIISQKTKDSLKVKLGDEVRLNILGKEDTYKIAAVVSNNAMFFSDKEKQFNLVTPEENIFPIYNEKSKYTSLMAAVDSKDLKAWVEDFNKANKDKGVVAYQLFDEEEIESQMGNIRMPLYFMLSIVLLMTTFIIYSSFKLIITERMSTIGTFLSQGATKGGIMKILLKESLAYGVVGGIIGDLMGAGLTYLIAVLSNPLKELGVKATTEFYPPYFITGFIFAIILSVISSVMPILAVRKLPVKDVVLNTLSTSTKISYKGFIVGIVFIAAAVAMHAAGEGMDYTGSVPSIFLAFLGIILVIPKLIDIILTPVVRILRNISGKSMLAFNNVKTSKVLINNMRLIAVAVISIVMMSSIRGSIGDLITGVYKEMNFDVYVSSSSNNKKLIDEQIKKYGEIENIVEIASVSAYVDGDKSKLLRINSVDTEKFKSFENYLGFEDKVKQLDEVNNNEDGIIVAKQLAKTMNIKVGDSIKLTTEDKTATFKVLSLVNAKMFNGGNYNIISRASALKHFGAKYPNEYFISTKNAQADAKKEIETSLRGLNSFIISKDEMEKQNAEGMAQMLSILGVFSYITMVIGAFGILSNVSISFIQRKREMAVVSSVGLTKGGRGFIILLEGLFQALVGSLVSLIAAYGIIVLLNDVFKFLTMDLELMYPMESLTTVIIATIILMILTSLSSIFRSRKLSIVNELRYE